MELSDLIGILVEQNKSFIEQNKNYKDMLVFAVGSIITILVIFLTANFFTMRKFREEEIEKIQLAVIQNLRTNHLHELKTELNSNLESLVEEKFSSIKTELIRLESKISILESSKVSTDRNMKKNYLELKGLVHKLMGDFWAEKKVYNNAFNLYLDAGKTFLEGDVGLGHIPSILSSLEKAAKELRFVTVEVADFNLFSSKLDIEYHTQAAKISEILKEKDPL